MVCGLYASFIGPFIYLLMGRYNFYYSLLVFLCVYVYVCVCVYVCMYMRIYISVCVCVCVCVCVRAALSYLSAKDVTLGPTAIMSLLVSSVAGNAQGATNISDAVILSFMSGMIQLLLGTMRLGMFLKIFLSIDISPHLLILARISGRVYFVPCHQRVHLFGCYHHYLFGIEGFPSCTQSQTTF